MKLLATIITRIFEPVVILPLTAVIGFLQTPRSMEEIIQFLLIFFVGMIFPPIALLLYAIKIKKITNWDITERKERIIPIIVLLCLLIIDDVVLYLFGYTDTCMVFVVFTFFLLGFFIITQKFKISMHTGANAFATGFFLYWFGLPYWPVLLIVPLVGWSRVVRKNHTIAQVITGALYGWIVVVLSLLIIK
jgi:membrane-associated phospholipid phosphatase